MLTLSEGNFFALAYVGNALSSTSALVLPLPLPLPEGHGHGHQVQVQLRWFCPKGIKYKCKASVQIYDLHRCFALVLAQKRWPYKSKSSCVGFAQRASSTNQRFVRRFNALAKQGQSHRFCASLNLRFVSRFAIALVRRFVRPTHLYL